MIPGVGTEILPDTIGWDTETLKDIARAWTANGPEHIAVLADVNRSLTLKLKAEAIPGMGAGIVSEFVVQKVNFFLEPNGNWIAQSVTTALPDAVERYLGKAMVLL